MATSSTNKKPDRIYIVDNNPRIVELLKLNFTNRGAEVRCFSYYDEALLAIQQEETPDVVIVDPRIPDCLTDRSGYDFILQIRKLHPTLIIAGLCRIHNDHEIYEMWVAGLDLAEVKPINLLNFLDRIKRCLNDRQLFSHQGIWIG